MSLNITWCTRELRAEALMTPVQILVTLSSKLTIDRLRASPVINDTASGVATPSAASTTPAVKSVPTLSRIQLPYDPSAVLLLETLTSIVLKSVDSIVELWSVVFLVRMECTTDKTIMLDRPTTFDFFSKLLAAAASFSSLFVERVVAALLRLVFVVMQRDELKDSTLLALDILRSLPPTVLSSVAEPLMLGLSRVLIVNISRIE